LLQLAEYQSRTDASKLKSPNRLTALDPYSGNIDLKFKPSQFDFQFLFSVLVLCEDKQILKKIKIIFSTLPKTIQMAVSTVNQSDANKPLGSGLLVYVNCGMHSVRHTINKIYMGLHEMGADHIEIITGLSELKPADQSIQYFKNLSWTAWFSPEGKLIPFFPLCGRYGFNFNCDDLYTMYKVALKRNFFGSPDFEKQVRVMRFATTEIKKSKKKFTRDALQTRMLEIESEAPDDSQDVNNDD